VIRRYKENKLRRVVRRVKEKGGISIIRRIRRGGGSVWSNRWFIRGISREGRRGNDKICKKISIGVRVLVWEY
jgi:hypothetical protein